MFTKILGGCSFLASSTLFFKAYKSYDKAEDLFKNITTEFKSNMIHKLEFTGDDYFSYFEIKEAQTTYEAPIYMTVFKDISVPLGGNVKTQFKTIYENAFGDVPNEYKFFNNCKCHMSSSYKKSYDFSYYDYNGMVEYMKNKDPKLDIHKIKITGNRFEINDGKKLNTIYIYGQVQDNNFMISDVSDNASDLAYKKSPFILKTFGGIVCLVSSIFFFW